MTEKWKRRNIHIMMHFLLHGLLLGTHDQENKGLAMP